MDTELKGQWLIVLSLIIVPLLQLWPLPHSLMLWRPIWPIVILAFWAYTAPNHIGVMSSFLYCVIVEMICGIGVVQWSLAAALIVLFIQLRHTYLRGFSLPQLLFNIGLVMLVGLLLARLVAQPSMGFDVVLVLWPSVLASLMAWLVLLLLLKPISQLYVVAYDG